MSSPDRERSEARERGNPPPPPSPTEAMIQEARDRRLLAEADKLGKMINDMTIVNPMNRLGVDISESDRALVVAEQRLDRVRELCERWLVLSGGAYHAAIAILAILDSDDTPKHNLVAITEDADECGYKARCECGAGFSAYTENSAHEAHTAHQARFDTTGAQ